MKLRYITLIFTLSILFVFILIGGQGDNKQYHVADMTKLNEQYYEIVLALNAGEARESLSVKYGCNIYLKTDLDYASKVNDGIRDNKICMDYMEGDILLGKIVIPSVGDKLEEQRLSIQNTLIYMCMFILLSGYLLIGLLYYFYVRPFQALQVFASEIAKGNMDKPLAIRKENYFGAFTESFDLMREELKLAKENEYKANISKKELVAELSHDIKTPVAAIKATCEVLKIKIVKAESEIEKNDILNKLGIIERKSDMIDELIGNMFHATLEELNNLTVESSEEPSNLVVSMLEEIQYYENIEIKNEIPQCLLYMDKLRLKQVIDNIINNSFKYAGTKLEVSFLDKVEGIIVKFQDYGKGVSEEELPLITQKYYRGNNKKGKSGAGLGLFLAKYFMEHMKGDMECYNDNGFVVELFLRKV